MHVLADGDIHTSGELAKAIACGADAVVLGTPLAESAEALGEDGSGRPRRRTRRCRGGVAADRGRRAAAAGAGAGRAVGRPVRRPESGRWATPIDGQGRVLRPQGVPEGRPDRWGLTPPERLINWPDVKGSYCSDEAGLRRPDYWIGFRGSVTALRLTEKGYRVGVLEAGRRFSDEEFAKTSWDLRKFLWAPRLGCYGIQRIHPLRNVMILAGAGVGGGSSTTPTRCTCRRSRSSPTSSGHTSPTGVAS